MRITKDVQSNLIYCDKCGKLSLNRKLASLKHNLKRGYKSGYLFPGYYHS
jgi:hypothetical protein